MPNSASASATVLRNASTPPVPGAQRSRLENSSQPSGSGPSPPYSAIARAGELDERVAVVLVQRGADDLHLVEQPGLEEVQQSGQELALGEVTGRTEEDDGRGGRHGSRLPVCGTPDQTPRTGGG